MALAVVDLAQIKNGPLHPFTRLRTDLLDDAPVAMILAVLESVMAVQKGFAHSDCPRLSGRHLRREEARSAPNRIFIPSSRTTLRNSQLPPLKKVKTLSQLRKSG